MYGSPTLVKEIYKASLVCLEPELISTMTEEFEKLKDEFKYFDEPLHFMKVNLFLNAFYNYFYREDEPKDGGVIVIEDDDD